MSDSPDQPSRPSADAGLDFGGYVLIGLFFVLGVVGSVLWVAVTAPRPSDQPVTARPFEVACGWPRRYFPDAAEYSGPGPHPLQVVIEEHAGRQTYYTEYALEPSGSWRAVPSYLNNPDETRHELVACLHHTGVGPLVKTCQLRGYATDVPVHRATYDITVYEAKTGREVGRAMIEGARLARCPKTPHHAALQDDVRVYTKPDLTQIHNALSHFILRPAQ
ncbi:MAG TPA: hypothetical protein VIL34_03740 [Actinopolymorphaceae bacterium]|jgi:hypothetical protein